MAEKETKKKRPVDDAFDKVVRFTATPEIRELLDLACNHQMVGDDDAAAEYDQEARLLIDKQIIKEFLEKVETALQPFGIPLQKQEEEDWTTRLPRLEPDNLEAAKAVWAVIQDGPSAAYGYWEYIRVIVESQKEEEKKE